MYVIRHPIPTAPRLKPCVDRTKRIREAKSEAQKEIEEYRKQKEEEFKKFEAEVRHDVLICGVGLGKCGI